MGAILGSASNFVVGGLCRVHAEERHLSDRERTVLLLAAEGLTDKEIAKHLNLSQRTIGTYWERMRDKLGPYSRTQLVARFLRRQADNSDFGSNYEHLFASWDQGVWIISIDGSTLYANERVAELFGYEAEELRKANAHEVFRSISTAELEHIIEAAQQEPHLVEFSLKRSDDTWLWLSLRAAAVTDERRSQRAVALVVHDVSVQRRIRNTLDSCETVLQFLYEHSSDPIIKFDSDLNCIYANGAFAAHAQVAAVGKQIQELRGVLEPLEHWEELLQSAFEKSEMQSFVCRLAEAMDGTCYLLPQPSVEKLPREVTAIVVAGNGSSG